MYFLEGSALSYPPMSALYVTFMDISTKGSYQLNILKILKMPIFATSALHADIIDDIAPLQ